MVSKNMDIIFQGPKKSIVKYAGQYVIVPNDKAKDEDYVADIWSNYHEYWIDLDKVVYNAALFSNSL